MPCRILDWLLILEGEDRSHNGHDQGNRQNWNRTVTYSTVARSLSLLWWKIPSVLRKVLLSIQGGIGTVCYSSDSNDDNNGSCKKVDPLLLETEGVVSTSLCA